MKTQHIRVPLRDGEMGAYLATPDRTPAGDPEAAHAHTTASLYGHRAHQLSMRFPRPSRKCQSCRSYWTMG